MLSFLEFFARLFPQNPRKSKNSPKILFILKKRNESWGCYGNGSAQGGYPSGLLNSATFVKDMLNDLGFVAELVEVVDNDCIDREVTKARPDIVIIEALWVVPPKFSVLAKLHPKVKWVIRNHSEIPFLSMEGNDQAKPKGVS